MSYPLIPHFRVPLDFSGGRAAVVEQDSDDEIQQCIETIFVYQPGDRIDDADFGISEQAFKEGGSDLVELDQAVSRWEPRADVLIESDTAALAELYEHVQVNLRSNTSG